MNSNKTMIGVYKALVAHENTIQTDTDYIEFPEWYFTESIWNFCNKLEPRNKEESRAFFEIQLSIENAKAYT